ncbi:Hsp20/alpha crystallin family protein [Candidatus Kaiserbacteria bacterium]|nr:Hsp20/alpha crystallin family protein [Candidatus Kaiserbacteria bacterium]
MIKKPSFLERLTGTDSYDADEFETDEMYQEEEFSEPEMESGDEWDETPAQEEEAEGELPIDMFQTDDAIVIRALVAGVKPSDLDIAITRDMVTIKGQREEMQEVPDDKYFHRELFWGSFSRTILLPDEIVIDEAEAQEKHGLLEISLPRIDKDRATKLNVKVGK